MREVGGAKEEEGEVDAYDRGSEGAEADEGHGRRGSYDEHGFEEGCAEGEVGIGEFELWTKGGC